MRRQYRVSATSNEGTVENVVHALSVEVQTLLQGVPLPATKQELLAYARREGAGERELRALGDLPDREYRSLNDVREQLAPVQPQGRAVQKAPRAESGEPPGGDDYTRIPTDTGRVRE
jgi:hypothetical protein